MHISRFPEESEGIQAMGSIEQEVLSRDVVFYELTTSKTEANDVTKKDIVSTEIPIIKEGDCKSGESA